MTEILAIDDDREILAVIKKALLREQTKKEKADKGAGET